MFLLELLTVHGQLVEAHVELQPAAILRDELTLLFQGRRQAGLAAAGKCTGHFLPTRAAFGLVRSALVARLLELFSRRAELFCHSTQSRVGDIGQCSARNAGVTRQTDLLAGNGQLTFKFGDFVFRAAHLIVERGDPGLVLGESRNARRLPAQALVDLDRFAFYAQLLPTLFEPRAP
jgi:hypothetical protein